MNALLAAPRVTILRSWHLLILLPVLPYLAAALEASGSSRSGTTEVALLLLVLGSVAVLGGPAVFQHLIWTLRKELDLLRPAWLTVVFTAQVPLFFTDDVMFFVTSCAFLAALPFGAEFQHRTLAGLLAQPTPRTTVWRTKMTALGLALASHWALYLLARAAAGHTTSTRLAADLTIGVVALWATTPWWTLLCHGLLPGLVFSLALPAGAMALLFGASDAFITWDRFENPARAARLFELAVLYVLLPGYLILGAVASHRRWNQLESTDSSGRTGGMMLLGGAVAPIAGSRSPRFNLLIKELRLQTVTWIALTLTALSMGWACAAERLHWSVTTQEYTSGAASLGIFVTLLLAAAIPIAEERQLGTLDGSVLQPFSGAAQWALKALLAFVTSWAMVGGAVALQTRGLTPDDLALLLAATTAMTCAGLFASSGTGNGLRALLGSVLLLAASTVTILVASSASETWARGLQRAVADSAANSPSIWIETAQSMGRATLGSPPLAALPALVTMIQIIAGAVALVALGLSWRNFRAPAEALARYRRQSLGLLAVLVAGLSIVAVLHAKRSEYAEQYRQWSAALDHAEWFATLPPAEQWLWRATAGDGIQSENAHFFPVLLPTPGDPAKEDAGIRPFRFPLSPADKALIVHKGSIPESIREELRAEAKLPPSPVPDFPRPQVKGATKVFQMDPQLMRRYGLLPAEPGPSPAPAPVTSTRTPPPN